MDPQARGLYKHFLTPELCHCLLFIHNSLSLVGYRPFVRSLTLFDLVLAEPRLLPAVIRARQMVWDLVEEHFDKPCQVYVEHTSLISWSKGASIGWHHDSNRDYLSQRHFSAVAYLNTQGTDFTGGAFCFQSGRGPLHIQPEAGSLLVYTADDSNVHQVEPVTSGQRCTLTMWFTLDEHHQEDKKVLSQLASAAVRGSGLPVTMYQLGGQGPDIRLAQLQQLGVQLVQCSEPQQQLNQQEQQQQQDHQEVHSSQQQQQLQQQEAAAASEDGRPRRWMLLPSMEANTCVSAAASASACAPAGACVACFDSIQEAALTLYMLQWKLCPHRTLQSLPHSDGSAEHDAAHYHHQQPQQHQGKTATSLSHSGRHSTQQQQHSSCHPVCSCYSNSTLVDRAKQLLQEYLQAAGEELEQLLPVWTKLGALMPPPSAEHPEVHLQECRH